jgi:excisionase family DNA binding protein
VTAPETESSKPDRLLTSTEVGKIFRVDAKTVVRWVKTGKIECIKTLGGHHRFKESTVLALLDTGYTANSE